MDKPETTAAALSDPGCWGPAEDAGQHSETNTENCQVCGAQLTYFDAGQVLVCYRCGKSESANITCPQGHYICDACHGSDVFEVIRQAVLAEKSCDPVEIAEKLMNFTDKVPMLGCENAWIAAGALMAAIRNEGTIQLNGSQLDEALNRTRRQAVGGYCGLTGICGIAPAVGACFSIILGAACPKDRETAATMKVVGRIVEAIADETGPCCCKNFVRTALKESVKLAGEYLGVKLPQHTGERIVCQHIHRHPHGCRQEKCSYYDVGQSSFRTGGVETMFDNYDQFHSTVYNQEGVLGRKTKHLIALAASLAAGCEPWTQYCFAVAKEMGIPEAEINEAIAVAMTVGASKVRAMADKNKPSMPVPEVKEETPANDCKT